MSDRSGVDQGGAVEGSASPEADREGERYRPDLDEAVEVWRQMGDASLLRGAAAILVGFIVLTLGSVVAGRAIISATGIGPGDPTTPSFLATNLGARLLLAILAGYLTGKTAPKAPLAHAGVLAGVLAFMSLATIAGLSAADAVQEPSWYPTAILFVGPLGVLIGGALKAYQNTTIK